MIGGAGKAISGRRRSGPRLFAPAAQESSGAASVANRVDALTKLTALLELGVLTQEQHDAEYARVIECDAGRVVAQRQFGPVQLWSCRSRRATSTSRSFRSCAVFASTT
jgi:hypothetical protein